MGKLIDIVMPENQQEGTESFLETWFKKIGDAVRKHEPLLEINTDKVTMEVAAPADGILRLIVKGPNEPVAAGEVLGKIEVGAETTDSNQHPAPEASAAKAQPDVISESRTIRSSPIVRKLIQQHGLQPDEIPGSGRGGRITVRDVESFVEGRGTPPVSVPSGPATSATSRRIPHSPTRRATARHMVQSLLQTAPHVTALFDADLGAVIDHRKKHKAEFAAKNVNLTFTAYFVEAAVKALQAVPEVNSRWHENELEVFHDQNIGIAAATPQGLIVPVVQQAQRKSLFAIAESLQDLTQRARSGKLQSTDLQNGTFTITNHGVTGSLLATPIINQPQSAILGIGKMEKRVMVFEENGRDLMEIRPMVYVTLTIDHRALDGFQANAFLSRFVEALQEWQ